MMRFEDRTIDDVQAANDIVEIISQYVPLKRAGRNFKAACPFHQEKTPSFMVNPEKQIFHCFGCGAGGNVFSFLMRYENTSFPEALRQLAERAHIQLPQASARKGEGPSENERLFEVYRLAAEFYHAHFLDPEKGRGAREYFKKRGFGSELAEEFQIGWAPSDWRGLFEFLSKKGFPESLLLRSALVHRSEQGHYYDVFRGRLLFPIRNLQGKTVAFGGRLIAESEGPKYLNSPENPIFYKRRELFGLNLAKKFINRELPRILVVEGYLDFMRLYEKGFKASAATLGTSLTEDHVQMLKRFADEAIVIYDGDKAGEAASLRGLEVFLEGGMNVKLVRMPEGFDPDDFLLKEGAPAFQKLLDEARDFFDYKLEIMLARFNREDSLGLMRITNEFLETFVKVKNPVLLDRYLRKLAGALGVDENSLRTELLNLKKKTGEREKKLTEKSAAPAGSRIPEEEVLLLGLMMEDPSLRETAFQELSESFFREGATRRLFRMLETLEPSKQGTGCSRVLNRLEDEDFKARLTASSALDWTAEDRQKAFQDCLAKLKLRQVKKRLDELRRDIAQAERAGDQARAGAIVKEYQTLLRQTR